MRFYRASKPAASTGALHIGHVVLVYSQGVIHSLWKKWAVLQGNGVTSSSSSKSHLQIAHSVYDLKSSALNLVFTIASRTPFLSLCSASRAWVCSLIAPIMQGEQQIPHTQRQARIMAGHTVISRRMIQLMKSNRLYPLRQSPLSMSAQRTCDHMNQTPQPTKLIRMVVTAVTFYPNST